LADLVLAFHRLEVPGEGDEVAPVAVRLEAVDGGFDVAVFQCLAEFLQQGIDLRGRGLLKHRFLPVR
jgi:hypothetical protein